MPAYPADRLTVVAALEAQGICPVFYHPEPEACLGIIRAAARAGARVIEFTDRGDHAADLFAELTKTLSRTDPEVILGIGSIVDPGTAALYLSRGARFVVSPCGVEAVAKLCNRKRVAYMPGCGSVTEISQAHEWGCDVVKLFPGAQVGGPAFVKAVMGPMPWTKIMPTGGVEPEEASLKAWFDAGIIAAGMGSRLIPDKLVAEADWEGLEAHIGRAVGLARSVRG
ncbi:MULTISPECIES: bifunctional 4-hydroxy-2-oxoglutarate aldolase/2-dehydro-3-deoxy-phosphogluconate aldolase [unclassified Brevundimonas]|jgi:2-dehydro-3-deoxyphosphogluconate aldolase/(4S)-4-hydroxy-2-oxoglutarate aldolase|uniref:bifunctional 4-hydroxy-2-oxoglutarate aldolase/2-dehydro-3-deoxy-phosphogluconate aldolase n=1 Tax=unclassified Brevundimonas TaxID=2622653 RepID=UPI000C3D0112|nr:MULTISPECIES: bifunctional 4-hydroxy-2-oxoglutarate aldolase/2-dehydro-3-deoxy-phosphogluconate aldolase [unclassified Brevundimonas]MAL89345.1 bifunctional 4-hydroxy-2-oxoglutarate aldolase/2-dehydro-3-deoxy-phosphogluconate aldolase [Brevundimonas sp.]|tara:strand:- start:81969 stop:82646 length:678 start_codon:yes stop_codon:yes gene_type:complete